MTDVRSPLPGQIRSPVYSPTVGAWGGAGVSYDADASALFARFTTPPTDARKGLINAMIVALKAGGVWTKLDFLHVYAAADSQAARQNWKADAYNALAVGSPAFTADRGYTPNGSSSYVNAVYNPGDGGASYQFTQDSAHQGLWGRTNSIASVVDIGVRTSGSLAQINILTQSSSGQSFGRINQNPAGTFIANSNSSGHFVCRRSGSGATALFRNGSSLGTDTQTSVAVNNLPWFVGAVNQAGSAALFSSREYAAAHGGANLSDAEIAALYTALATYMTAVGA